MALPTLAIGGIFLLNRAAAQARDTIRKHHLQDIEVALYADRLIRGTYPPYDQPSWCGVLNDPRHAAVRTSVEAALRRQNEKYANPDKPFPGDPLYRGQTRDYFYWKHSPASFELYAVLEADRTGERNTWSCPSTAPLVYDYGLNSVLRENTVTLTSS